MCTGLPGIEGGAVQSRPELATCGVLTLASNCINFASCTPAIKQGLLVPSKLNKETPQPLVPSLSICTVAEETKPLWATSASRRATRGSLSLAASRDPADSEGDGSNFGRVKEPGFILHTTIRRVGERPCHHLFPFPTSSATSPSFSSPSSEEGKYPQL
ncbi:hypothetical protein UPYG_G00256280 [Umbra pygmaea]|uniref:Uncharacterized protein n=1 Tax=Umbra pygmaea TaxID=75934 RepID=A0ABD0WYJ5_UMBPY